MAREIASPYRRVGFCASLMIAPLVYGADSTAKPEPTESGIAAAKRDYDAVKAARVGGEQQKLALPEQTLPSLSLPSEDIAPARPPDETVLGKSSSSTDKEATADKSRNWLVDAMTPAKTENEKRQKNGRDRGGFSTDEKKRERLEFGEPREKKDAAVAADKNEAGDKLRADAPPNPLLNYMAAWMTPQDFELLKVKTGANAASGDDGAALQFGQPGGAVPAGLSGPAGDVGLNNNGVDALSVAKANPYLAEFSPPESLANPHRLSAPTGPEIFTAPANLPARIPESFEPPPAAKPSELQDQLTKARDDAKYFKQLKRF